MANDTAASSPKVLLVEDDSFLVGMYVTKLELEHFQTFVASEGDKGLEVARSIHPDLVLLDIVLPKMDGFTVLEHLKSEEATRDIPVILLTNLGQQKDVNRGLALGANDYLVKAHYMPSEVVEKIKALIQETRKLRAIR